MSIFKVGDKVFFRAVTYHVLGEIAEIDGEWLALKTASWIADSGRFSAAIAEGTLNEVEFVGDMNINLATVTDATPWKHALPISTK